MKHFALLTFIFIIFLQSALGQYYYQDMLAGKKTSLNFAEYKNAKVKKVTATSYEKDGSETENFGITQLVNTRENTLTTITRSDYTGTSTMLTYFNAAGNVSSVIDSGINIVNKQNYGYTSANELAEIQSKSFEPGDTNNYTIVEKRMYSRNAKNELIGGMVIKNNSDTIIIKFTPDANGKPSLEQWYRKGIKTETWFYYYDDMGRLTDIVRYNERAKKMLPDYVFEYNAAGQLEKQTIIQPGSNFYRNILYEYNEKGLKKAESIFYKSIEQEGRVVFEYD